MIITRTAFQPSPNQPFQFTATLDGAQYNVVTSWGLFGQRWYVNVLTLDGNLVVAVPRVGSPSPLPLAPPAQVEVVSSMTWTGVNGGTLAFVMAAPSSYVLGDVINVSGATNSGTGGDGIVNGTFRISDYTDQTHFSAALTTAPGVVGTIGGAPVLNVQTYALSWSNATGRGIVTANTALPHRYPLGSVVELTISGAAPDAYNGRYLCVVPQPTALIYPLATDPGVNTVPGSYGSDVSLVGGYFEDLLVWREANNQYEVIDL